VKGNDLIAKLNLSSSSPVRIFDGLVGGKSVGLDTLQTKTYYIEADSVGCSNEVRQKVDVKIVQGTLPSLTTTTPAICTGTTITFADVSKEVGSASGLVWYSTKTGGAAFNLTDKLTYPPISQTYYAAYKPNQVGICESKERIKVTITFVPTPTNITMADHFYEPCKDAKETVANIPTAPFPSNTIAWFISPTAFNPLKTTDQLYSTKYYAAAFTQDLITGKKCYSSTKDFVDVHLYEVAFIVHPENSVCEKNTGVLTIVENDMHGYSPFKISIKDQFGNLVSNTLKTNNLPIGEYTIEVTDKKNCKQKVRETIGCTVNKIPHVITPDDATGTNDRWKIQYYEKYPNVQVTIFNRWGSKVYTSAIPYMDDWDGRASSEIQTIGEGYLPAGTYYYVIDKGNGDAVESGYIELLK
jgi:gliding motility-associated-like protein